MRCALTWLLAVVCSVPLAGCGSGGLTQDEMRRRAIRRPSKQDGDDDARAVTAKDKQSALEEAAETRVATRPKGAVAPADSTKPGARPTETEPPKASAGLDAQSAPAPDSSLAAPLAPLPPSPAPDKPLTLVARRQRTIDNLTRIAAAVKQYCDTHGRLFLPAIVDSAQRPLLSWRVELLPYLGYQQLYEQFHRDEPWNSPHNQRLLAAIPPVYQSPERFDEKTNYVVPVAAFTPFSRPNGIGMRDFEDGASETIVLLEADDSAAVVWTEPADLPLDLGNFAKVVGNLREGEFLAIWGDGTLSSLSADCPVASLRAVFTYDGGELFSSQSVRRKPTAEPDVASDKGQAEGDRVAASGPETLAPAPLAGQGPAVPSPDTNTDRPVRSPVPDPLSLEKARDLVRELYHKEYESKQEISQQQAMAQRMLKQAEQMTNDPAGRYVLLDIAIKIATRIGDTATALSALDDLTATYEVDELSTVHAALVALAKKDRSREGASRLLDKARNLIDPAIEQEQFDMAETLCQIGTAAARQLGDRQAANALQQQAERVEESQKALRDVQRVLATLTEKDDPDAHLRVGRYYCFIKGDWEKGLPMLAKGSDTRLQRLAEEELRNPSIPEDQLKLADGWWELGDKDSARQKPLHQRAAYWYERALPALPSGLWRAKVEMRLKEFRQLHGENAVASSRTPVRSPPPSAGE